MEVCDTSFRIQRRKTRAGAHFARAKDLSRCRASVFAGRTSSSRRGRDHWIGRGVVDQTPRDKTRRRRRTLNMKGERVGAAAG